MIEQPNKMKKIIFLLYPRQTGKTNKAIYEFLKDKDNTIFVCHNLSSRKEIREKINGVHKNFITQDTFENKMIGRNPKNIILDEYMFYRNKDKIYSLIHELRIENVFIYSTSNKVYRKDLLNFVKENKKENNFTNIINLYEKRFGKITKEINDEIYELYYNFITDHNVNLIDNGFYKIPFDKSYLIKHIGKEQYDLEILNKYLK